MHIVGRFQASVREEGGYDVIAQEHAIFRQRHAAGSRSDKALPFKIAQEGDLGRPALGGKQPEVVRFLHPFGRPQGEHDLFPDQCFVIEEFRTIAQGALMDPAGILRRVSGVLPSPAVHG
jgi:hypothetical protein